MDQTTTTQGAAQPVAQTTGTTATTPVTTTPVQAAATTQTAPTPTAPAPEAAASLFNKFDIPEAVRTTYPDLVPMILETESMNDDERQYWFQILPIMTEDQVKKLREILGNEKKQLAEIDKQYNKEVAQINDQHVTEWKEFERKDKREKLKSEEVKTEAVEAAEQDQLLAQLNNI